MFVFNTNLAAVNLLQNGDKIADRSCLKTKNAADINFVVEICRRKTICRRIKIAAHLSSHAGERTLYILDEPTTGLHFDDIAKLLAAFRKLLEAGNTLLVIEHNLDVIKTADYIIDLGPEGGDEGGRIVAVGTPEQVVQVDESYTGKYLRAVLAEGRSHAYAAGR